MMGFWDLVRLELRTLLADRAIMLTLFGGVFFTPSSTPSPTCTNCPGKSPWWWSTRMAASSPASWSLWPMPRRR